MNESEGPHPTMSKKNILFFFCDQFLWRALGCAGHSIVRTPNVDRLAAKGVRFSNAYSASPACVPARISLFTGQYAHTHGQLNNGYPLRADTRMFIETLQQAGYHTGAIGFLDFRPVEEKNRFDFVQLHNGVKDSDYMRWLESIDPALAEVSRHAYPKEGEDGFAYGSDPLDNHKETPTIIYGSQLV